MMSEKHTTKKRNAVQRRKSQSVVGKSESVASSVFVSRLLSRKSSSSSSFFCGAPFSLCARVLRVYTHTQREVCVCTNDDDDDDK